MISLIQFIAWIFAAIGGVMTWGTVSRMKIFQILERKLSQLAKLRFGTKRVTLTNEKTGKKMEVEVYLFAESFAPIVIPLFRTRFGAHLAYLVCHLYWIGIFLYKGAFSDVPSSLITFLLFIFLSVFTIRCLGQGMYIALAQIIRAFYPPPFILSLHQDGSSERIHVHIPALKLLSVKSVLVFISLTLRGMFWGFLSVSLWSIYAFVYGFSLPTKVVDRLRIKRGDKYILFSIGKILKAVGFIIMGIGLFLLLLLRE